MITINLSRDQADSLMRGLGWRDIKGTHCNVDLRESVAAEVFRQIEHKLMPCSTAPAELAVWRHEQGFIEIEIEKWKRKHETAEEAFGS